MLIIVPIHKKIDWKHPPVVTLLLVAANILIFLLFQLDDGQEEYDAVAYYRDSGLAKMEYKPVLHYLKAWGYSDDHEVLSSVGPGDIAFYVQTQPVILEALHGDEIIKPSDPIYADWKKKRQHFESLYEKITYVHYGARPARPTLVTEVTSMFLHGGFGHLFGNMIFLLAVGLLVEATLNALMFLLLYFLVGLGAGLFFIALHPESLTPSLGASGAISGLMGSYAVFYGLKKIRFFYFIGVYFDQITLPALILLPLWIGDQLIQIYTDVDSHIAYTAHLGGLIVGGVLAFLVKKTLPATFSMETVEREEAADQLEQQLGRVRQLCSAMDYDSALPLLRRLHGEYPDNLEVLSRFYECAKLYPASEEYHRVSHRVLSLEEKGRVANELVRNVFNEYIKLALPKSRLNPNLICRLAHRFTVQKALPEAEMLVKFIVAKQLGCPQRDVLLSGLAKLLAENGRAAESQRYARLLVKT